MHPIMERLDQNRTISRSEVNPHDRTPNQARAGAPRARRGGSSPCHTSILCRSTPRQLEFYKTASQTELGVFVIIDYGDLGNKLNEIRGIRDERLKKGERASEIIVIDGTRK